MKKVGNRFYLILTVILSFVALVVGGVSTYAWFQITPKTTNIDSSGVKSGSTDLTIDGVAGYKYAYDDRGGTLDYSSGHVTSYKAYGNKAAYNIDEEETSQTIDAPSGGVGYYIKGDETWAQTYGNNNAAWKYASAVKMDDKYGNNLAAVLSYDFVAGEQIKIYWHHYEKNNENKWVLKETPINTIGAGSNLVTNNQTQSNPYGNICFNADGNYNIWVYIDKNDNDAKKLSITKNADPSRSSGVREVRHYTPKKQKPKNSTTDFTKIIINGNNGRLPRTLRLGRKNDKGVSTMGFSSGYNQDDLLHFLERFYGEDGSLDYGGSNLGTWDNTSGTTRGLIYSDASFQINAGTNAIFYLPSWLLYCPIYLKYDYSGTQEIDLNYLDNLYNYNSSNVTDGVGKTITINLQSDYNYSKVSISTSNNSSESPFCFTTVTTTAVNSTGTSVKSFISDNTQTQSEFIKVMPTQSYGNTYTQKGIYTAATGGSRISAADFFPNDTTVYARYTGTKTYINLVVKKELWNASNGSYDSLSTGWSYTVTQDTLQTFAHKTAIDTSEAPYTSNFTWHTTWYTDESCSNDYVYDTDQVGSTSENGFTLYTYVTEKTTTITFYKQINTANSWLTPTNLNLDGKDTNQLTWGISGTFRATDWVTEPSAPTSYHKRLGWGISSSSNTVDATLESGKTITNNTSVYLKFSEYDFYFSFERKYFLDNGASYTNPKLPGALSEHQTLYKSNSGTVSDITVGAEGVTDSVDSNLNTFYVFERDEAGVFYTDAACTDPYSDYEIDDGTVSDTKVSITLYIKMVARSSTLMKIRMPDHDNNGVKNWGGMEYHIYYTSGNLPSTESNNDHGRLFVTGYYDTGDPDIITDNYYCFYLPEGATFIAKKPGLWSTSSDTYQSWPISLAATDYKGKTRSEMGNTNIVQLWEESTQDADESYHLKAKWNWMDAAMYLVGENLVGSGVSWSNPEGGIKLTAGSSTDEYLALAKNVSLTNDVVFKVYTMQGTKNWLGGEDLLAGETKNIVEDDGTNNHNIKMKGTAAGIFNIKVTKEYKIIVEDANKTGIAYFTGITGVEQQTRFYMGVGGAERANTSDQDDYYYVYEKGIQVKGGDKFLIRIRVEGKYVWLTYDNVDAASQALVQDGSSNVTLGDTTSAGLANETKTDTPIEFKSNKAGTYNFYIYKDNSGSYKLSIKEAPSKGYGYYIIPMASNDNNAADNSIGSSGEIKMRTLSSGTNVAMYTGLLANENDRFCFKSNNEVYDNTGTATDEITHYTNFYDNYERTIDGTKYSYATKECLAGTTHYRAGVAAASAYVTFDHTDYYDIYIYSATLSGTQAYWVSIVPSSVGQGNFFTLNSLVSSMDASNMQALNTTLIIRVDFTVTSEVAVDINLDLNLEGSSNGFGKYLHYYADYDTNIGGLDPYKYFRNNCYGNLAAHESGGTIRSLTTGITTGSHWVYIMIDYPSDSTRLTSLYGANSSTPFSFILSSVQH